MGITINKLQKINSRLQNFSRIIFLIILTSVLYFVAFCFNFVLSFIKDKDIIWIDLSNKENSITFLFILPIILAPIFETFLGQYLPYYLLNKVKYLNERSYLILLASALFFGLLHFYSLFYIIYAFMLGLIFMYGYMIRIKTDKKAFILIAISHSILNLGIFIKNLL
jgi:hypothetical protein